MTKTTIIKNDNDKYERAPVNAMRPTRAPSSHADVEVPAKSGLVAAGFVFMLFIAFAIFRETIPNKSYIGFALMVSIVVGMVVFFWRMQWTSKVIWAVENVVGMDMSGDGVVGEPRHPVVINKNNDKRQMNNGQRWQKRFEEFVNFMYDNGTNHHAMRNKFSEKEIAAFRQYCLDMGICRWRNDRSHQAGLELAVDQIEAEEILAKVSWIDVDKTKQVARR